MSPPNPRRAKTGTIAIVIANFLKPAPPISYTPTARLTRAVQALTSAERSKLMDVLTRHQTERHIQFVQRRGQFLHVGILESKKETIGIYDFGGAHMAQACLTALTDCLRSERLPVRVLMPTAS